MTDTNLKIISQSLESARRMLLDTGTRNRLIHVNRANQRANCLNIINERADNIYSLLKTQGKRMRFKAMGKDRTPEGEDLLLAIEEIDLPEDSDRLTDNIIETPLGPETLARRLLRLAGSAKTAEEEQGVNILYLAIGFLRWTESASSEIQREAPLVLLPVQLVRNERTSTYNLCSRDDDISTNLPLRQRLQQFEITLPEVEEDEEWNPSDYFCKVREAISEHPSWSVDADGMQLGFFSFAKLLMHRDLAPEIWPDGAFIENPLLNGLLNDGFPASTPLFGPEDKLDEKLDPAKIIQVVDADASQTIVIEEVRSGSSLVVQGPPGTGKSQTITNIIASAVHDGKTILFVAEKMAALSVVHSRLVKSGLRDICLELHSRSANKKALAQELGRTLGASAKKIPSTLDPRQLREKRDKLNQIAALLHSPIVPHELDKEAQKPIEGLKKGDCELNARDTPFNAISEIIGFIGKGARPPEIPTEGLELLNGEKRASVLKEIETYVAARQRVGDPQSHPFRGTTKIDLQPTEQGRLEGELKTALDKITDLLDHAASIATSAHQPEPRTIAEIRSLAAGLGHFEQAPKGVAPLVRVLFGVEEQDRLVEALEAGAQWEKAHKSAKNHFVQSAWTADVEILRPAIVRGVASWFFRLIGKYRQASNELASLLSSPLPKAPAERLKLLDEILGVQALRRRLADDENWLSSKLDSEWRGERTPFGKILTSSKWIATLRDRCAFSSAGQLIETLETLDDPLVKANSLEEAATACFANSGAPLERLGLSLNEIGLGEALEEVSLEGLSSLFQRMADDQSKYNDWADYLRAKTSVEDGGARTVVEAISQGRLEAEIAVQEFSYACAEARWNAARKVKHELNELSKLNRHELVNVFCDLERDRIETAKNLILSRHFEQMPKGSNGGMGVIRGEIGRKRRHMPIRKLMKKAGEMIQRIKPVMLMSPISVAQFLPPGEITFDLLVIDEASQVRPEDALGVIARAKQIVVVGDQKQLPPTRFFNRLVEDDEEDDTPVGASAAFMESILSLCEARGLQQKMLEWHYRSRDPSLIRVSNAEFYDDRLVLPPSPLERDPDYGLKFRQVSGEYARGGSGLGRQGTNRIEAEAVAKAVAEHARVWPDKSLGVVAFSKAQADMLTEVLDIRRRQDQTLDEFMRENKSEDIFVKNIENVQGDERDVIFISVGYGPQESNGRLKSMNFGPVNSEGGERRLNVLFTRARHRCEVFSSFDPGDIDPSRAKQDGTRILKRFLDFAKSGCIETKGPTGREADSPFEEDVTQVIDSLGYIADLQVGSGGFRIDIGVRHKERPGQYLVAVECDGASYHSAVWARERDRLRQEILESLGWRFHRIWSTDWFHNREREIERLKDELNKARIADSIRVAGVNSETVLPADKLDKSDQYEAPDLDHLILKAPAYVRANFSVNSPLQPHEVPPYVLTDLVAKIVETEGPIHKDEIARRVASAFGLQRAGKRIVEATNRATRSVTSSGKKFKSKGKFVFTDSQFENPPVRDRSSEEGSLLKAEYLSPKEILAATQQINNESGEMPMDEMTKAVARLLGYQRVGPDLFKVIKNALTN